MDLFTGMKTDSVVIVKSFVSKEQMGHEIIKLGKNLYRWKVLSCNQSSEPSVFLNCIVNNRGRVKGTVSFPERDLAQMRVTHFLKRHTPQWDIVGHLKT
jgi:hypothetical protein